MSHCVYVINLDGSDARMASAKAQLDAAGIAFERVAAFDGRRLTTKDFPGYDAKGALSYMGRSLRGGEIGCYLSHLDCARRFLESGTDWALVLEDDFCLAPGAHALLEKAVKWLTDAGEPWRLINVGALKRKIYTPLISFEMEGQSYMLSRAHYFPLTTTGLVWSRAGAKCFLDSHSTIFAPVDNYFRHWLTRVGGGLSLYPPIAPPVGLESEIDAPGQKRKQGARSYFYGLRKQRRLWQDKLIALIAKFNNLLDVQKR